ncbi:MAG: tetratricopeptide repeat protein [Mycobacteriaceae bacterium]
MSGAVDLSALKAKAEAPAAPSGSPHSSVVDVTEATFQAEIVDRSMQTLVVVDLWASWCEPCKQLSPVLERLAAASGGAWVLAKVDVDAHPRIAELFEVKSLPTVVAIAGGQPVQAFSGAQPEAQIKQWIAGLLTALKDQLTDPVADPPESGAEQEVADPRFEAAEQALQAGDFDTAIGAYQNILDAEPSNADAAAGQAKVRFLLRLQALPADVIARADAAPEDIDAQLAAADAEVSSQQVEAAFTRLVSTVRRSTAGDKDRVRARLLSLFELFEPGDPLVVAARRKLASALY